MISLKALELFGFKSFADRTRFDFPEGVTAVVGPNGSGKSNVVDAIKWVLGEQSARSLRGKEMTDVIFAGSTARKPLNMAEVALVFDNRSRELPLPTDEVQIMRRVYRSGESEYLVNGQTARLKDIREVFSGTGAATEAYSVIEQGRVDAILTASGRDRRAVFEEAAGITRFRTRRGEALRRLERAEQNRQRLADIVGEVASRLETVRNQATRARRWRTMSDRLKALRIAGASRDLTGVDAAVTAVAAALVIDRGSLRDAEARALAAAGQLATLSEATPIMQAALGRLRSGATTASQREAAATATLRWQSSRRKELEADAERVSLARSRALRDAAVTADEATTAEALAATATEALSATEARLAECERQAAGTGDDALYGREALTKAVEAHNEAKQQRLRLENTAATAAERAAEMASAVEASRDAAAAARGRRARFAEARAAGEGHRDMLQARLASLTREVETAEMAHRDATAKLQTAWRDLADGRAAAEACRERRDVLRDLVSRQEGLSDAARQLLGDVSNTVPGLAGTLADSLVVPVEWAELVDLALGQGAQSLLVESLDDVIGWHASWSQAAAGRETLASGGRVGFVSAADLSEPPDFEPAEDLGIVGRLDRLVLAAADMAGVDTALLRRLLGRTWIVESLGHAAGLLTDAAAGTLFLTRSGECLSAAGGLEIGTAGVATGLVARRSELRTLEHRADELAADVERAAATVSSREAELARIADEMAVVRGRRQQAADSLATSRAELGRIERDERAADDSIALAEEAVRDAERRAIAAETAGRTAQAAVAEANVAVAAAEVEVGRCRAAVEHLDRSRGEILEEIQRLKVDRVGQAEKVERYRAEIVGLATRMAARRDDLAAADRAVQEAAGRTRDWERELLAAVAVHAEMAWEAEQAAVALAAAEDEAARDEAARQAVARDRDAAREEAAMLSERIHTRELEEGEARHQRVRIVERIRDEYDLDIDSIATTSLTEADSAGQPASDSIERVTSDEEPIPEDRDELERAIEELRRKVANMGNVNLEALAEAEELSTRLATLEAQLHDVTSARESIEQLIARIDDDSRRLLGETIETVRGHFRELFERVFGGGQADLVLEPGVDLLETSVEIVARPPGKEPRNISLLSGGEKTMTCVALLLAIFRSRPSPFCVLDEVDAALDEANVDRFVGVLRDFLSATQFIVVTHSKKTMAAAGTLYGVTMEESGVSKRVSVRFESSVASRVSRAA